MFFSLFLLMRSFGAVQGPQLNEDNDDNNKNKDSNNS